MSVDDRTRDDHLDRVGSWTDDAACRGRTPLFYAVDEISQRVAATICRSCPVRSACLADVRDTEPSWMRFGVRAGMTASQRRGWDEQLLHVPVLDDGPLPDVLRAEPQEPSVDPAM
jgi:hypothetical protein